MPPEAGMTSSDFSLRSMAIGEESDGEVLQHEKDAPILFNPACIYYFELL